MICLNCSTGADIITEGLKSPPALKQHIFMPEDIARALHEQCHGCDCQHNVDAQLARKSVRP